MTTTMSFDFGSGGDGGGENREAKQPQQPQQTQQRSDKNERLFDARLLDRNACVRFSVLLSMAAHMMRKNPAALGMSTVGATMMTGALNHMDATMLDYYCKALPSDLALDADADLDDVSGDSESLCAQIAMIMEEIEARLSTVERTQNPHKRSAPPASSTRGK